MLLWLALLLSVSLGKAQLRDLGEGEQCELLDGSTGTCKFIQNCPSLIEKLTRGIPPAEDELCSLRNHSPVVCCIEATSKIARTESTPAQRDALGDGRGEIARQKCLEYGTYVYEPRRTPTGQLLNISVCAITTQKLIVGGTRAEPKEFPHMAAVGYNNREGGINWSCGGTLVSETFVMTAAHCTYSNDWGEAAWIRVGDLNLVKTTDDAKPQERRIVGRIRHPDYQKPSQYNDIALLRMDSPVKFTAWVRPACLYTQPATNIEKAIAVGWGSVQYLDYTSDDLLKVTLPLVSTSKCHESYKFDRSLKQGIRPELMLCAGAVGKDTCQGDSGGPLVIYGPPKTCMYDVIGVTSLGQFCGSTSPGVYTRVYHYISWLESVVWP